MNEKRVIAVDSQMLEGIQTCSRYYNYAFVRHITTHKSKFYLDRGTLLHSILSEYYSNGKNMDNAISKSWIESAELTLTGEEVEEVHNNLRDYAEHYSSDRWEALTDTEGQPLIERVATKILFEDENFMFVYQGVIDLQICIAGMSLPDGLVIVDHKSTNRRSALIDLNNQFIGYCWMTGCQRIIKNEIGFQKSLKPHERFVRHLLSYEATRIEEWVENSIHWLKQLVFCHEADIWPMNLTSCSKWSSFLTGGGCMMIDVCTATPDFREYKLERDYKIREPWDVGRKL